MGGGAERTDIADDHDAYEPRVGGWGWAIFFFSWIGGLIGYFSLKDLDPRRANHVMKWGLIVTLVYLIVGAGATVALEAAVGHSVNSGLSTSDTLPTGGFTGSTVPPAAGTRTTLTASAATTSPLPASCVAMVGRPPDGAPAVPVETGPPPKVLVKRDLKLGSGAVVSVGETLTVDYIGVACSTGKIFDSSYSRGQSATFSLSGVIPGWQQGIPGMRVGGERLLGIPPQLAYGSTGSPPDIAPNETLWFVVHVRAAR